MAEILQYENPILRAKATPVPLSDITKPVIQKIIKDMRAALGSQNDGVALAAPQIGISLRIFVVAGKVFDPAFRGEKTKDQPALGWPKDVVFINPKIIKKAKEKKKMPEGCLSVRWLYGDTMRAKNATVEAYDETGKKFTRGGGGLLAQIFQHEIEHLDGILFIDHAKNIEEIPPEKSANAKK